MLVYCIGVILSGLLHSVYTMEYYSAIKKNTFESVLVRWMKLEPIIQSEGLMLLNCDTGEDS